MKRQNSKKQVKFLFGFLLLVLSAANFSCGKLQLVTESELERNRRVWRESGIANYRMTVNLQKTGHAAPMGKFVITVRRGAAESIKAADNPEAAVRSEMFANYNTIERIFDYIERANKEEWNWNKKEIEYDSKLGYPKKVNLDAAGVFDEELLFQVLQFEILQ